MAELDDLSATSSSTGKAKIGTATAVSAAGSGTPSMAGKTRAVDQQRIYAEQLEQISEFASYGPLFHSTRPVALTESETEYIVSCVRHVFSEYIVFQFDCTNTINDQLLENVIVQMEAIEISNEEALEPVVVIPAPALKFDVPSVAYVAYRRTDTSIYPSGEYNLIMI